MQPRPRRCPSTRWWRWVSLPGAWWTTDSSWSTLRWFRHSHIVFTNLFSSPNYTHQGSTKCNPLTCHNFVEKTEQTLLYHILWLFLLQGSFPAKYYVQNISQESYYLDNNHQAFLLVDDGSVGRRGETGFRAGLEDYISHQRTGSCGERWYMEISCM